MTGHMQLAPSVSHGPPSSGTVVGQMTGKQVVFTDQPASVQ
jgi:hypothetical protein